MGLVDVAEKALASARESWASIIAAQEALDGVVFVNAKGT